MANSRFGSPICGRPSWSDRGLSRPAEPNDWLSAGITAPTVNLPIAMANPPEEGG